MALGKKLEHVGDDIKNVTKKIEDLVEVSFDCFWETDRKGYFRFLSENIYDQLGYKGMEVIFRKPEDLFVDSTPEELKVQFRVIMSRHESFRNLEIITQTRGGDLRWFRANATVKYNEKNEFDGYMGAFIDETSTKNKQYEDYVNINVKA